jgi:N-hydroxyarylamine O-acetyltransferase
VTPQAKRILDRIGYRGPTTPTLGVLTDLQRCFLLSVPFENLDLHLGRSISLISDDLYRKIALHRRGGFCYECNALFYDLLVTLGYHVQYASARMAIGPEIGPEFDHMILLVELDAQYLVDVGNGQSCREPLALGSEHIARSEGIEYRVDSSDAGRALYFRAANSDWAPRFWFDTTPRERIEFEPMCHYHQTSPDSVFTRMTLATIATPRGRVSLMGRQLTMTRGGDERKSELTSEAEISQCLHREFRIELEQLPQTLTSSST